MDDQSKPAISPLFAFHKLNDDGQLKAVRIAEAFHNLYSDLHTIAFDGKDSTQPGWEGREWAIVRTKLEEACFYAKKSMATQPENQETT